MAKAQVQNRVVKKKNKKDDDEDVLVGRIKKVVKKSRRKLSEEKFERQLQRTIAFLEQLQTKLNDTQNSGEETAKKKTPADRKARPDNSRKRDKAAATPVKPAVKTGAKPSK
jgi:Asp-tRNA(Asn)/Glu-tRNA(Gln) amidotransferase C subunit